MMESGFFNREFIIDVLIQIKDALSKIESRTENIKTSDDFWQSPGGMILLDAVCMRFIAIGESLKSLDKGTRGLLLSKYPDIPWRKIMGLRDIIAHHYFHVDVDAIMFVLKNELRPLKITIEKIMRDLS